MSVSWVYRRLVESYLNKPSFEVDNGKIKQSFPRQKFDETNNSEFSKDISNERNDKPMFKKRRVYYFSPAYLSSNRSTTTENLYKFYLNSVCKKHPSYEANVKYVDIDKIHGTERNYCSFYDEKHNFEESFPTKEYVKSSGNSENQFLYDFVNQHVASPLCQVFDILQYYFIFPFYVSKMIFYFSNADYYYVRHRDITKITRQSQDNVTFPDKDTYSFDDETFENVCLHEIEENIEEFPSSLLLKKTEYEALETENNGSCEPPYNFLSSVESQESTNASDQYQPNYTFSDPEYIYVERFFKNVKADEENQLDTKADETKLKISLNLEKYDFVIAKLIRKLVSMTND